jgi:hypothetical protein
MRAAGGLEHMLIGGVYYLLPLRPAPVLRRGGNLLLLLADQLLNSSLRIGGGDNQLDIRIRSSLS